MCTAHRLLVPTHLNTGRSAGQTGARGTTHVKQGLHLWLPMLKIRHKLFPRHVLHPRRVKRRVLEVVSRRERRKVDERTVRDRVCRNLLSNMTKIVHFSR